MKEPILKLEGVEINFMETNISDINLEINENDFVSILGKSGIGKTSMLNLILGNISEFNGKLIYPKFLHKTIVFQEYNKSLFPWFTVYDNLSIVVKKKDLKEIDYYLDLVGLIKEKSKFPWQLSGGMQQRLALARALLLKPQLLLLDEPFGSLDYSMKEDLEDILYVLYKKMGITIICVTHDIEGALFLSNKIYVMTEGTNYTYQVEHGNYSNKNLIRSTVLYNEIKTKLNL